jgi:hypothetical protein
VFVYSSAAAAACSVPATLLLLLPIICTPAVDTAVNLPPPCFVYERSRDSRHTRRPRTQLMLLLLLL